MNDKKFNLKEELKKVFEKYGLIEGKDYILTRYNRKKERVHFKRPHLLWNPKLATTYITKEDFEDRFNLIGGEKRFVSMWLDKEVDDKIAIAKAKIKIAKAKIKIGENV